MTVGVPPASRVSARLIKVAPDVPQPKPISAMLTALPNTADCPEQYHSMYGPISSVPVTLGVAEPVMPKPE
ncbi:hypothetical protein D3C80_996430 [compost metagenome]